MEQKLWFENSRKLKLAGILNNPSGDTDPLIVIILHGHTSHKNSPRIEPIADMLASHNISSFRIDLAGHGESEGNIEIATVSDAQDDVLCTMRFLKSLGYSKIGLFGSGFGGMAAICAAAEMEDLRLLILRSPVVNYEEKYRDVEGKEFLEYWKKKGIRPHEFTSHLRHIFYEDAVKHNGYEIGKRIAVPTLIIHGDKDEQIPVEQSKKLAQSIRDSQLMIIRGADHRLANPGYFQHHLKAIETFVLKHG